MAGERIRATYETVEVGERLGPVEYGLTEEDVASYLERVQDEGEALVLPDGRRAAPPTITAGDYNRVLTTKYSTYDVVHTKARHEFKKPIVPPMRLRAWGTIVDKYIRRGREYLVIETVTEDESGAEVVRSRNTWLINASVRHPQDADTHPGR